MRLSLSQKEELKVLFQHIDFIFNDKKIGLIYSSIEEAWIVGDTLRDILLFRHPLVESYNLYFQVKNQEAIYPWLSHLTEVKIPYDIKKNMIYSNENTYYDEVTLFLQIKHKTVPVHIIVGTVSPQSFIENNMPVSISLLGLDISKLFIALSQQATIQNILTDIWFSKEYQKSIKNKTIYILKQEWMKNHYTYAYLEEYLFKFYQKFNKTLFCYNHIL